MSDRWSVVLPVKGGRQAKSRLGAPGGLALAMALDCVESVLAAGRVADVVVVTADDEVSREATGLGARVIRQPDDAPGLPGAVSAGLDACSPGRRAAVLLADLPCLRPDDLDTALAAVGGVLAEGATSVVVPDARGSGTVLLAARRPSEVRHSFGDGSAARHERLGALRLQTAPARLRRDVDTRDDLTAAVRLGVGPRTARTLRDMQATVLRFDSTSRSGEVVTDDGVRLAMAADALEGSGLLHLRPGQRVTCTRTEDGCVTGVHVHGISG